MTNAKASPWVAVGSTGGTIGMRPAAGSGASAVVPTMTADDLLRTVPGLDTVAGVRATTLMTVPGASLTSTDMRTVLVWAREQVDAGAEGAVLVQGTDTLDETSWLLDLWWDRPKPLVFTGAMRTPDSAGADGPANVLDAVRVAVSPEAHGLGSVVVIGGDIHPGSRVRKSHTTAPHAFVTPDTGPIGRVHGAAVVVRPRRRPAPLPVPDEMASVRVALLETHMDDDGTLLRAAVAAGFDAVVVAAFGAGHVSQPMAEVIGDVASTTPVVVASRTGGGSTLRDTYGFVGSERDLLHRGALLAGWLDARRARALTWAVLSSGGLYEDLVREVQERGGRPE